MERGKLFKIQLAALPTDYTTLLNGQIATHGAIYDRVQINLNASRLRIAPCDNDTLLTMQSNSSTPVKALWERIFDAGRYYFLSSSSSNTPPDLFGMWTGDCNASCGRILQHWMPTSTCKWLAATSATCRKPWPDISP